MLDTDTDPSGPGSDTPTRRSGVREKVTAPGSSGRIVV